MTSAGQPTLPRWFDDLLLRGLEGSGNASDIPLFIDLIDEKAKDLTTVGQFTDEWRRVLAGSFESELRYGLTVAEERAQFFRTLDLYPDELRSQRVLVAGCGLARLDLSLRDCGAKLVSLDAGEVLANVANSAGPSMDHMFVRADILTLPFRDEAFDFVFCEGVLHHTTDPRRGFHELARVCRKGGRIGFYLYPQSRSIYRRIRRWLPGCWKLPRGMLLWACRAAGGFLRPIADEPTARSAAFSLFDTLCCRDLSEHSVAEIRGWIKSANLQELRLEPSLKHSCVRKPELAEGPAV